jgi:4-hydroxybutyrate CoA-transferase
MTRWIGAEKAGDLLKPGMTVFVAGATSEPREVLEALAGNRERCAGVRFVSVTVPGINHSDLSTLHEDARSTVFLVTPDNRWSVAEGRTGFVPMHYSAIYRYLEQELDVDVAILQLPPADRNGSHSLGISADFAPAVLGKAKLVIGEVNSRQPSVADAPRLLPGRLDYAVACDRPVPTLAQAKADKAALGVGRNVAELVNDGDCIQIGIGAIPDAALSALSGKNDLGVHSGMISNGVRALAESGNINGRCQAIDHGRIVCGATLGGIELVEWAGRSASLSVRPVGYTHDGAVLREIENFVSINSALEIDLFGQVNAEMLDGRQVSGTGGAVDMMRGAALSKGGRSIVALSSTAGGGKFSRIVSALAPVNSVTALRTDVEFVVTEFGARRIRHLPLRQRAEALIEISHPDYRDRLLDEWHELAANQ